MPDDVPAWEVTIETQVVLSAHQKRQPGEGHCARDGAVGGAEESGVQGLDWHWQVPVFSGLGGGEPVQLRLSLKS